MEQEDEDLKISQKSMLTDDIATADAERDGLYSGYKKAVYGFKNLPVENRQKQQRYRRNTSRTMPSTQRCNLTRKRDTSDY